MTESVEQAAGGVAPSGKKHRWLWVVGAVAAIIAAYVGWNVFDSYVLLGESTITVSPETTYLTGPLNADGTVNYTQALIDRYSEGVTPDNNAMTLLVQAFGPDFLPEETRAEILRQLGLSEADLAAGKKYVSWRDYLEAAGLDREQIDPNGDLVEQLGRRPWAAEDHPQVAAWLDENAEPMEIIRQAASRPRCYFPIVSADDPPSVLPALVPGAPRYRSAAWALAARAMLRLAEGDIIEARADANAIHSLARTPSPYLIWHLINVDMVKAAANGQRAIIASDGLSPEAMRDMLADLKARPPMPSFADAAEGEVIFALDMAMLFYRTGYPPGLRLTGRAAEHAERSGIDWDSLLRRICTRYRAMMRAATDLTYAEHRAWESQMRKELEQELAEGMKHLELRLLFHSSTQNTRAVRKIVTRALGNVFLTMLTPELAGCRKAHEQVQTRCDLTLLALAAKVHEADHGDWPEQLADLAPEYLDAIPNDRFTDQPLMYVRTDDGVRMYSLGPNMTDDAGLKADDQPDDDDTTDYPKDADDLVIELR